MPRQAVLAMLGVWLVIDGLLGLLCAEASEALKPSTVPRVARDDRA